MARANRRWSTPSKFPRTARVNELLREVIASSLEREVDDPRLELVTVTEVKADSEFHTAIVYYSALDNTSPPEEVQKALERVRVEIQAKIAAEVRLKRTPQLKFILDSGIVEGQKIESILENIRKSSTSQPE